MVTPSYFQATLNSLMTMEAQVEKRLPGQERQARVVRNVAKLDAILAGADSAPIAIVHTVEGAHSL